MKTEKNGNKIYILTKTEQNITCFSETTNADKLLNMLVYGCKTNKIALLLVYACRMYLKHRLQISLFLIVLNLDLLRFRTVIFVDVHDCHVVGGDIELVGAEDGRVLKVELRDDVEAGSF